MIDWLLEDCCTDLAIALWGLSGICSMKPGSHALVYNMRGPFPFASDVDTSPGSRHYFCSDEWDMFEVGRNISNEIRIISRLPSMNKQ